MCNQWKVSILIFALIQFIEVCNNNHIRSNFYKMNFFTELQTPKGCTLTPEELEEKDDEMEQEDMFIEPHEILGTNKLEWGGPRRGGRLAEPTRFGDWERKGRCTDF